MCPQRHERGSRQTLAEKGLPLPGCRRAPRKRRSRSSKVRRAGSRFGSVLPSPGSSTVHLGALDRELRAHQMACVVGDGLLQEPALNLNDPATSDLAKVEALLQREHQRLDRRALVAGERVLVTLPVVRGRQRLQFCTVVTNDSDTTALSLLRVGLARATAVHAHDVGHDTRYAAQPRSSIGTSCLKSAALP